MMIVLMLVCLIVLLVLCLLVWMVLQKEHKLARQLSLSDQTSRTITQEQSRALNDQFESLRLSLSRMAQDSSANAMLSENLLEQMSSINRIMSNAKARGNWGEYQMESLINLYGGQSDAICQFQYRLENGKIADGAFHIPGSEKVLCIDSKFPVDHFPGLSDSRQKDALAKEFEKDMKKHIDDVSSKYITPQTVDQAILFLPSEAIYQYVCARTQTLLDYALRKHVILCSPTTLAAVVFSLEASTRDFYRAEHLQDIQKGLDDLQEQMARLQDKINKVTRSAGTLYENAASLQSVSDKLERSLISLSQSDEIKA